MNAGYDVLFVAHVAAGVVGFGAIGAAGYEARSGLRAADPAHDLALRRFFRPGVDWAGRVIFLVPLLGLALLFGGTRPDVSSAWPWIGLAIWLAAAGVATGGCWPAERAAQSAMARLVQQSDGGGGREEQGARPEVLAEEFRRACLRIERSAGAVSLLFLAAVAVMIAQP